MLSTAQIIIIALAYMCLLFFIAYSSGKHKAQLTSAKHKAIVYSFALAIYCTSWTFYGAVGTAATSGWNYLPIYLGPILIYTVGFPLLKKIVLIAKKQNTTSISDFIASRYGKSQTIAAIVTLIAVMAVIPYMAMQLKAIATSIQVFDAQPSELAEQHLYAFYVTLLMIIFSILFGTRNISIVEHQRGLMNAVAFESIIKLIAFCTVGSFALVTLWQGTDPFLPAGSAQEQTHPLWFAEFDLESLFTQTLLAAAAILCLPRQFHVAVVEYHQPKDLQFARWIFPIYLSLFALFVIPIAIAGTQYFSGGFFSEEYFSGQYVNPDTYILALPIIQQQSFISALVFIGGLSAATAMIIVGSIALSTMLSNDIVFPVVLRNTDTKKLHNKKLKQKMLFIRRIIISISLLFAYSFYRIIDKEQTLASIGYLSFSAVLQFLPALLLGLYWQRANKYGAIAGLLSGSCCWFLMYWLPTIQGSNLLANEATLTGLSLLTEAVVFSQIINFSCIIFVSLLITPTLTDKIQAYAFTHQNDESTDISNVKPIEASFRVKDLKSIAAALVGNKRMLSAFNNFSATLSDNDTVSVKLVEHIENTLAAAIGAASSRAVLLSAFKAKQQQTDEVINLLNSTSQALTFNRKLVETTMDNITQGICVSDAQHRLIAWNQSYQQLLNYPPGFLKMDMPIEDLIRFNAQRGYCGEGDIQTHIDKRIAHLNSGLSYRYIRKRDDGVFLEIVGNPLPQAGYVTTFTDISDYKNIESALRDNEQKITLYTDNSPALLAYLDKNLYFRFANIAMAENLKTDKEKIIGTHISQVISKDELAFKLPFIQQALANYKQHFEYADEINEATYYLVTYIPHLSAEQEVLGIYTIAQDISNRRQAELALQEINASLEQRVTARTLELSTTVKALETAKIQAEVATQSKSQFLAAASHDLLQPFNAARLFCEILKEESPRMLAKHAELIEKTDQSLSVAESILRSLVDFSKLDSNSMQVNLCTFNIHDTFESLETQFSGIVGKKSLKIKFFDRKQLVKSDPELLYRILQNLLSNAIRYTNKGGILVTAQSRKNSVRLSVWDTGIGIKTANQQVIFDEFKQLSDPQLESTDTGIGLGLSISERIAKFLSHPLTLSSIHGRGSAFHIELPLVTQNRTSHAITQQYTSNNFKKLFDMKVLCVDNDERILDAMTSLLLQWGCNCKGIKSKESLDALLQSGFTPQLMLVDFHLDHGDTGIQLINIVRQKTSIDIPAIIITADYSSDVEKEVVASNLKLIHKPVKPAALRLTINQLF